MLIETKLLAAVVIQSPEKKGRIVKPRASEFKEVQLPACRRCGQEASLGASWAH